MFPSCSFQAEETYRMPIKQELTDQATNFPVEESYRMFFKPDLTDQAKNVPIPYDPVLFSHRNYPNSSQLRAAEETYRVPIKQELTDQATNVPVEESYRMLFKRELTDQATNVPIPYDPLWFSHRNYPNSSQLCAAEESYRMPMKQELTDQATNVPVEESYKMFFKPELTDQAKNVPIPFDPVLFSHRNFPNSSPLRAVEESYRMPIKQELTNQIRPKEDIEIMRAFMKRKRTLNMKLRGMQKMKQLEKDLAKETESGKSGLEQYYCSSSQPKMLDVFRRALKINKRLQRYIKELEKVVEPEEESDLAHKIRQLKILDTSRDTRKDFKPIKDSVFA